MSPITRALNRRFAGLGKWPPWHEAEPAVLLRSDVVDGNPLLNYELSHGATSFRDGDPRGRGRRAGTGAAKFDLSTP